MSESVESPNQTAMAETEPLPPPSAANSATKYSNVSFSIWPPSERTRDAVKKRLIETLSTPSILSKRYGTIPPDEAIDAANRIEEEAFEASGKEAKTDDEGIEILQVYSKEISKRMLDTVKARSADSATAAEPPVNETVKAEEEDSSSTAPPQSEKTESVADDE